MTPEWVAARAGASQGDPESWRKMRLAAAERLQRTGFPGPRDESWKYTRASAYQRGAFAPEADGPTQVALTSVTEPSVVFVDGWLDPAHSLLQDLSRAHGQPPVGQPEGAGISLRSVREAPHAVGRVYGEQGNFPAGGFLAANLALARDGLALHVPAERSARLVLVHVATPPDVAGEGKVAAVRHAIELEPGARLELIEHFVGGGTGLTSAVSEIVLGAGAELVHVRRQDEAATQLHYGAVGLALGAGAHYQLVSALIGGSVSRVELDVLLRGEGALAELSGLAAMRGSQHADHHVTIDHASPRTASRQQFRSLLDDRARGVFTGRVIVRRGAQGTDATQSHRALLLSDEAIANARPQLEIDTDDVKCAHGAAVGALDEEALFYLQQRGLDPGQARALLTGAFASEILQTIPFPAEQQRLVDRIAAWLEAP